MDLSKIGKCELCVLEKQVRVAMVEAVTRARESGVCDDELIERYERCREQLKILRDWLCDTEFNPFLPQRNLQEIADSALVDREEKRKWIRKDFEETIREAMQLIGAVWAEGATSPP